MQLKYRPDHKATGLFIFRTFLLALFWLQALGLQQAEALEALDLSVEGTVGYDSNPALEADSDGSGFSLYAAGLGKQFRFTNPFILDTFLNARYQDYWQVEDNYDVRGGGALSYPLANGRFTPALLLEAAVYRDHLVEAAERNEVMVGFGADLIVNSRMNLRLESTWNRQNYLNWAQPFSGRGQGRPIQGKGGAGASGSPPKGKANVGIPLKGKGPGGKYGCGRKSILNEYLPPRDNRLIHTVLTFDLFFMPSLSGSLYGGYTDLKSSVNLESYGRIETGIVLSWEPFEEWQVMGEAKGYRVDYHDVPDSMQKCVRRTNLIYTLGLQVSRFLGPFEIFAAATITDGEAPLDYESYSQRTVQCGLSYFF
jgi:hypothetical protein